MNQARTQGKQVTMNGSEYIEFLRSKVGKSVLLIPSIAAVILDQHGRLLLQEKHDESWSLPTGMIEPGESPREAIVREVKEETGLVVAPGCILGVFGGSTFRYSYSNGDSVEYTVILMRCSVFADSGVAIDEETKSIKYFDKHSMPELALPYPKDVLFGELAEPFIL